MQSSGHDTVLTEIPDIAAQQVWSGAMARHLRNGLIEHGAGQEWHLRQCARQEGDVDNAFLLIGQDAGLIDAVLPVHRVIEHMVAQASEIITTWLPQFVAGSAMTRLPKLD